MYEIRKDGAVLALTEKPTYIYRHTEGFYALCDEVQAQGIAVNGKPYSLHGRTPMEGCESVLLVETDAGDILRENEQTSSIAFVTLAEAGSIDAVTAGEHKELFTDWKADSAYTVGQYRKYAEKLYRCIQAHTSQAGWEPDAAASLWAVAADPAEQWPAWSQPVGAHDAYAMGDKVSHNGVHWTSSVAANVWEPGVYGWTEAA
jgi:hypothetical protein